MDSVDHRVSGSLPSFGLPTREHAADGGLTLARMFQRRVERTPRHEAYREFDAAANRWRSIDWQTVGARVLRFARALDGAWLARGARIGVLLPNGM